MLVDIIATFIVGLVVAGIYIAVFAASVGAGMLFAKGYLKLEQWMLSRK